MVKEIEANALIGGFFPQEFNHGHVKNGYALEYLNSSALPGTRTRLDQIVGYLKPEAVQIVEETGVIRMIFADSRELEIKGFF